MSRRVRGDPGTARAGAVRTRPDRRWLGIRLTVPASLEEPVVAALWEAGCLGVESRPPGARGRAPVELGAWFAAARGEAGVRRLLGARLRRLGLGAVRPRAERLADDGWVEAWQCTLRPMRVGRRFLVVPEGCAAPASRGRLVLRVPYGQAFGTGEHASTRLVLRLIEARLRRGARVVDCGTGTGILAVAARRLGARRVVAVDDDPVAVRVARRTLRLNAVGGVALRRGDAAAALRDGPFELALVNIGATTIRRLLPALAASLTPGGQAVLSGILATDERDLLDASRAAGLAPAARVSSRPWFALVVRRPAPA